MTEQQEEISGRAARNGHDPSRNGNGAGSTQRATGLLSRVGQSAAKAGGGVAAAGGSIAASLATRVGGSLRGRLHADLDDRDPDYIRENLPLFWLLSTLWFRGEVRNMGNVPEEGPVLLVGNHSGGNLTPDTTVFTIAFYGYFGVERAFYQLAHNLVLASPVGGMLRKYGTVSASHEHAQQALRSGSALLVYPGGDWEVHRPSWQSGKIDFAGRKGFVKLAMNEKVPIVPVVSIGGQETSLFLGQGSWLASLLRVDRNFRLKVMPISLAIPWGLNIGDFFGHLPLPAKITVEVLPPIDIAEQFGEDADVDEVYEHVTGQMQKTLDALHSERRYPVLG